MSSVKLSNNYIEQTIQSLCTLLHDYYLYPDIAELMNQSLIEKLSYYTSDNGLLIAEQLTYDLQNISKDKHLFVNFSEANIPSEQFDMINDSDLLERQRLNNFGFERVEILRGNIGYIVLNEFVYPEHAGNKAAHAMSFLADTDGLIIDLRRNYGGSSFMSTLIASYLLDASPPVHLQDIYWRQYDKTQSFWSLPYVPGQRFGSKKPIYILTSQYTGSCAEEFSYSLQAIKRVKIIGERTSGKANAGGLHRVNEHFQAFIPNAYPINPITKSSWNDIGVVPDIECSSDKAFDQAYHLLLQQLIHKFSPYEEPYRKHL